jgi:ATP-dependent Clp protease ATP-binding subunit ClpA
MGFAPAESHPELHATGGLRISGSLLIRERGSGFGIIEGLAVTIDEVIEFQVLDRAATETIIAERLESLSYRLASAQSVAISMDSNLAGFFADRLADERKSLGQLERLLQEAIVLPFSSLRLDRSAGRPTVRVSVESGLVKVAAA